MWSLGKVVQTPEVCRVYMGSFWDAPLKLEENRYSMWWGIVMRSSLPICPRLLLDREKSDLLNEMMSLPGNAVVRRINELVKRARSVKVTTKMFVSRLTVECISWAYECVFIPATGSCLHNPLPSKANAIHREIGETAKTFRSTWKVTTMFNQLMTSCITVMALREFAACARRYNLPLGDFPNVEQYRKMLSEVQWRMKQNKQITARLMNVWTICERTDQGHFRL